ncbi:MAG: fibronectin type III domain-containing protein [Nitrospirae bacterium]|nr:fibronectin type III domain-containing protein [Nitrospirota bacterium]
MNFAAHWANGGSWRQYNSCDGLSWTQNINTSSPVYIERGYWYKHKLYIYAHATNGRMRLWVQREDWPQEKEIIDTNLQGCGTLKTLTNASSIFSEASPHYNYDDHGGGGANPGFEIWLDDMIVEDTGGGGGDTQAPTVPTGLSAQAVSSSQINLSWSASTDNVGVTGYRIYRCTGSSCTPSTQIATSPTTSYSDTGLSVSTTYTYSVSAVDAAGNESLQSAFASATTSSGGGGDSGGGSGGGGGCGFVKDDNGKGPKAKGEGLSMILLLLLLILLKLRKRRKYFVASLIKKNISMTTLNLIFIKSPCVPLFQRGSDFFPLFSKEGLGEI